MAGSTSNGLRWFAGLAGLAAIAIGVWLTESGSPEQRRGAGKRSEPANAPVTEPTPTLVLPAPLDGPPTAEAEVTPTNSNRVRL